MSDYEIRGPCLACGGLGCAVCEPTGLCPGCGEEWEARQSPLSVAECAAMGLTTEMCRTCGKHWRRAQGAVALTVVDGGVRP